MCPRTRQIRSTLGFGLHLALSVYLPSLAFMLHVPHDLTLERLHLTTWGPQVSPPQHDSNLSTCALYAGKYITDQEMHMVAACKYTSTCLLVGSSWLEGSCAQSHIRVGLLGYMQPHFPTTAYLAVHSQNHALHV